eukprot:scaffold126052_cov41-Prasinocladus_malaysianus.AAC.1
MSNYGIVSWRLRGANNGQRNSPLSLPLCATARQDHRSALPALPSSRAGPPSAGTIWCMRSAHIMSATAKLHK